ncbi:hypothetical protein F5141DRAFT_1069105 [Pisolithus sp. B1]|nr:hypothetical protein F5141DRAFT_1069105 [Pisolithus sp. B1]
MHSCRVELRKKREDTLWRDEEAWKHDRSWLVPIVHSEAEQESSLHLRFLAQGKFSPLSNRVTASVSKVPEKSRKLARWWNGNSRSSMRETIWGPFGWCRQPFGHRNACCPCTSVVHNPPIGSMNHFEGVKRGVDGRMSAVGISPHRSTADTLGGPFDPSTSRGAPGYPRSMHEVIGGGFGSAGEFASSAVLALMALISSLVVFDSTSALSPHSALAVLCTPFPRILLDGLSQYQARMAARSNRSFALSWLVVPPDAHFSTTT